MVWYIVKPRYPEITMIYQFLFNQIYLTSKAKDMKSQYNL